MLKNSSKKINFIPKNPKFPSFHSSFPSRNDFLIKVFFTIQMSLGVFMSKISHRNESHKILIFAALTFISLIFRDEISYAKYVALLDKLKDVKKSPFFSTVSTSRETTFERVSRNPSRVLIVEHSHFYFLTDTHSFYSDGLRQIFDNFPRINHKFSEKLFSKFLKFLNSRSVSTY
jgi:hypothetical protein